MVKEQTPIETNAMRILANWPGAEEWFNDIPSELTHLVDIIRKRVNQDKDFVYCLSAVEEGSGKSTLGVIIGFLLDPKHFDLRSHVAYIANTEQIRSKFKIIPSKNQLLIDEGITSLHKHDWAMGDQKNLSRMLVTERWQNKVVAVAIPRLQDLPESVRNHKVKMNIKIMKRGLTVVHIRDDSDSGDPWWLAWAEKYQQKAWAGKHIADIDMGEKLKVEKMKRTFLTSFEFPKLPKPIEEIYEQLKQEAHTEADIAEGNKESKLEIQYKEMIFNAAKFIKYLKPRATKKAVAEGLKITPERLKKVLDDLDPKGHIFGGIPIEELVSQGVIPGFVLEDKEPTPETSIISP